MDWVSNNCRFGLTVVMNYDPSFISRLPSNRKERRWGGVVEVKSEKGRLTEPGPSLTPSHNVGQSQ
jgi:hypothetical protein